MNNRQRPMPPSHVVAGSFAVLSAIGTVVALVFAGSLYFHRDIARAEVAFFAAFVAAAVAAVFIAVCDRIEMREDRRNTQGRRKFRY